MTRRPKSCSILLFLISVLFSAADQSQAQSARLVRDINTVDDPSASSDIGWMWQAATQTFFVTIDMQAPGGVAGLWRTDGTPEGTRMLATIRYGDRFRSVVIQGDRLFFHEGQDLWRSDGTVAGTAPVPRLGDDGGYPAAADASGGLYFTTTATTSSPALIWRSDAADWSPAVVIEGYATPLLIGNTMYLLRDDRALWKTDGTPEGTVLAVPGFCPISWCLSDGTVAVGGKTYYSPPLDPSGRKLWRSDGTPEGTFPVIDVGSSVPLTFLTTVADRLFYAISSVLYRTDGTANGTVLLHPWGVDQAVAVGSQAAFIEGSSDDCKLWVTDGTPAGTGVVKDFCLDGARLGGLASHGNWLHFFVRLSDWTVELWRSDGTPAGTYRVRALSSPSSSSREFASAAGTGAGPGELFVFDDGVNGQEMWRTDGTAAGTIRVTDRVANSSFGDRPQMAATADHHVFFEAIRPDGNSELWKSDGTEEGTVLVKAFSAPAPYLSGLGYFTAFNGGVLFTAFDGMQGGLWRSTRDGQTTLLTIGGGLNDDWRRARLPVLGPHAFFVGPDGELWATDGSIAGTQLVKAIHPGAYDSSPRDLTVMGGYLFFTAGDEYSRGLWRTDGTEGGTVLIKRVDASGLKAVGSGLFFLNAGYNGTELWKSDGTADGTAMVARIDTGYAWPGADELTDVAGTLFFRLWEGPELGTLWKSDGTAAGTQRVTNIAVGPGSSAPEPWGVLGTTLLVPAWDQEHGLGLWKSDGTAAGTRFLAKTRGDQWRVLFAGSAVAQGRLFFAAGDGDGGYEPWVSDGTPVGTHPIADIAPGPAPSNPRGFTAAGNTLFFVADDGVTGSELWSMEILPTLTVHPTTAVESVCRPVSARFLVTLSHSASEAVTVDYATADGTAVAGSDYVATSGTLTFQPGRRRQVVTVPILSDRILEPTESFRLLLSNPQGAELGVAEVIGTIRDRPQPKKCSRFQLP